MLTGTKLATAQALVARRLTARCDIYSVSDDDGAQDWETASATDVRCQVGMPRQGGALAMELWSRIGNEPGAIIWVLPTVTAKAGDRIHVTTTGKRYSIAHAPDKRTGELLWGLVCIELREPGAAT